ncbi:MAG: cytochrome c [Sphingomonadales bacterium]|nr:cytochrome c [Sphingomonadales bacterium]
MTKRSSIQTVSLVAGLLALSLQGCYYDNKAENYGSAGCDSANPTYTKNIAPLINQSCIGCHGSSGASAGVSLTTYDLVKTYAVKGSLMGTLKQNGYSLMPPGGKLSDCKISQVDKWIQNGMPQ